MIYKYGGYKTGLSNLWVIMSSDDDDAYKEVLGECSYVLVS